MKKKKMSSGEEEEEEEEAEEEQQQQLEEGLYEIEELRKKRVRKGQIQYLIKWRGWPESSNTWEPYDSLHSTCADVIEAFEQQQSTKSSRKRKRRTTGGSPTTNTTSTSAAAKKKKPSETTDTAPPPPPPVDNGDIGVSVGGEEKEKGGNNSNNDNAGDGTQTNTAENTNPPPVEANGSPGASTKDKDAAGSISVQLNSGGGGDVSLDEEEDPSKTEGAQAPVLLGAKKRKSGCVKRFTQEPAANQEEAGSTEEDNGKCDPPHIITKILMPVDYCATVTDDVQRVSITFRALRSDGREVIVDNKDLKANNPELLFSYYEQHLRYSSRT
ncbi:putative chromo domain-containing protein LHP1 [Iris pallida]|uniref:Chromo domain-containing protein LHP1 n=1 Tax=Iris pallida TaxID=29817 RepID=A0AAX6H1H6_IRIPA|nr:putative chromo domain-containing protein LHP1 [Iris pallida]